MPGSNPKLITLLWIVIVVLVVGSGIAGFLMYTRTSQVEENNEFLRGDNVSLKRQLEQAKAAPKPSPKPALAPAATTPPSQIAAPKSTR